MYLFYLKLCHDYNNNNNDDNNNENNNYNDNSVNFIINIDNNYNSNAHNNYYDNYMTITTTYNGYDDYDISFTNSDDEYDANLLVSLIFCIFLQELGIFDNPNYKISFLLDSGAMITVLSTKYGLIEVKFYI